MEDQQAPTPDDETHDTEAVGPAGADARRPKVVRRRWKAPTLDDQNHGAKDGAPAGANVRRSVVRRRRRAISRRRRPTFRNMAPMMEDQRAPTTDDHRHGAEYIGPTGAEDVASAGTDARRPEVLRRSWRTGANVRRSEVWRR